MKKVIYLSFILGLLSVGSSCKKSTSNKISKEPEKSKYQDYVSQAENRASTLSQKRKDKRTKWLTELNANRIYINLVNDKIISVEYLPVLTAISDAIKNAAIDKGESVFSIDEEIMNKIEKSKDGQSKINFVITVSCLALKMNGGLPKEIVDVFDRYKTKFKSYGSKGDTIVDTAGNKEIIDADYNISYTFALFNPEDEKALDAIYESVQSGNGSWNTNDVNYENAYMAKRDEYMKHLKKVYKDSPYLIDADFELTPKELYSSYNANEVSADEEYKNKKILLTGSISDIGKDITDKPYISFRSNYIHGVTCYFSDDAIKAISKLSKGDKITVLGKCKGLTLGSVIMSNCKIIE